MSKAIVTLLVGEPHTSLWRTIALPTWERYAQRHGYQIVVFDHMIDDSSLGRERSPSWQKLLTLGHPRVEPFERVLWLDADIVVNDAVAPCPVEQTPPERVGVVVDQALGSCPPLMSLLKKINNDFPGGPADLARYLYEGNGLTAPAAYLVNGGVLVLSRQHRHLLEHVYRNYRQGPLSYYEQVGLSCELLTRNLQHLLDARFNLLWMERQALMYPFSHASPSGKAICIGAALDDCFFLHFAARIADMALYDPRVKSVKDGMTIPLELAQGVAREWRAMADQLAE